MFADLYFCYLDQWLLTLEARWSTTKALNTHFFQSTHFKTLGLKLSLNYLIWLIHYFVPEKVDILSI
jgi:hypothetical protein